MIWEILYYYINHKREKITTNIRHTKNKKKKLVKDLVDRGFSYGERSPSQEMMDLFSLRFVKSSFQKFTL